MKLNTGIRALQKLFRSKGEKDGPMKTGQTAALNNASLSETDEPDIMYLEETPAICAKKCSAAQNAGQQKKETGDHRYQGKPHSQRLTFHKRISAPFHKNIGDESDTRTNQIRQKHHRIRLFAAYGTACLALIAGLLIFVLPEGGHAATELLDRQPVVLSDNPRVEQMEIDPSQIIEAAEPTETPDVPTVTSSLFDDSEKAAAAAMIIEAAEATPTPEPTITPEPVPSPITVDELVEFFVDESGADYGETGYATNSYEYTDDEFYLLAQIIDIEARGEPFEGMVAVGNVVMNRVLNTETFGHTITSVVKSGQFAWSGRSHRRPSLAAKRAAKAVLDDQYWVLPQNVYFFKSHSKPGKDWGRNQYYTTIEGHCFYVYGYNGRYNGDGIPPKLYERTYKYAQFGCKPEERVLRIQQMLNGIGFHVNENSYFDKNTRDALTLFQETNALNADGVATLDTITALIKAYGFENYVGTYVAEQDAA